MSSSTGPSKNPFLSPSLTGSSQLPTVQDAFANLNLASSFTPPPPTIPSSSRPNNPFLDTPSRTPYAQTKLLSREEVQTFENSGGVGPSWWNGEGGGGRESSKLMAAGGGASSSSNAYASTSAQPSLSPLQRKEEGYDVPPSPTIQVQRSAATSTAAQQNETYRDDQAALDAAIAASLGEAPPSRTSSPPAVSSSTPTSTSVFATFPGPPPPLPARPPPPARASSTEAPPSIDPPPAYTPMGQARPEETTVDAGPMRPAFTEPEPRQFQHQQQTVGTWIEPQHTGWSDGGGNPGGYLSPQPTGFRPPLGPPPSHRTPFASYRPPPMQQNNSYGSGFHQPPPPPSRPTPSPNSGPQDTTPSALPIPGRPYLNDGKVLVYTPGFQCPKCLNTGYKVNDPSHPCRTCWKKYGRQYTSAMALSWEQGVTGASNWQRPLGVYRPPPPIFQHGGYPGNTFGGPGLYQQAQMPPPGAIVYQPGDPRIGGRLCYRCGGSGYIIGFFEDDQCQVCRGIGRVF